MSKDYPSYYSVLTADVRYDKDLKAESKILFSEITALSNKFGYCTALNEYFCDLYEFSERTIQRYLKQLTDGGYITVEWIDAQRTQRRIFISNTQRQSVSPEIEAQRQDCRDAATDLSSDSYIVNNTSSNNEEASAAQGSDTLFNDAGNADEGVKKFYEVTRKSGRPMIKIKMRGLFGEANAKYDQFMKDHELIARFDAGEGAAMKSIIKYFVDLVVSKDDQAVDKTQDDMKDLVLKTFDYIFASWHQLPEFYRKKMTLKQINSNIINIINEFKNVRTESSGNRKKIGSAERVWSERVDSSSVLDYLAE